MRWMILIPVLIFCSACATQQPVPPAVERPTPTIAAMILPSPVVPAIQPVPMPASPVPTLTPTAAPVTGNQPTPSPIPFVYLWPAYLPNGMAPSAAESRVAGEGEAGLDGLGFFIVTFNGGDRKIVIGGGSIEAFPLEGQQRRMEIDSRPATLTSSGKRLQVIFDTPSGKLFVYGSGVSEQELLLVAGSLLPIDVREMREQVKAQ